MPCYARDRMHACVTYCDQQQSLEANSRSLQVGVYLELLLTLVVGKLGCLPGLRLSGLAALLLLRGWVLPDGSVNLNASSQKLQNKRGDVQKRTNTKLILNICEMPAPCDKTLPCKSAAAEVGHEIRMKSGMTKCLLHTAQHACLNAAQRHWMMMRPVQESLTS